MANRPKFTSKKREQFLEAIAAGMTITAASASVGVSRRTVHDHRADDPEFAAAFEDAWVQGGEVMEDEAFRRAVKGTDKPVYQQGREVGRVREYSDTLMIFLLKGRFPDKYKERVANEHGGEVRMRHAVDLTKLSDDELDILEALASRAVGPGGDPG